jgi:hypothetical protein
MGIGGKERGDALTRAGASRSRTLAGYLTKVIVLRFAHGTGWEADDRQGDWAGMSADVWALHASV